MEYGWVCAPNGAAQTLTANTVNTLSCDTRVSDFYGFGAINPTTNTLSLSAGTYLYEAHATIRPSGGVDGRVGFIVGLWNNTSSTWISRIAASSLYNYYPVPLRGQFTIDAITQLRLQALIDAGQTCVVQSGYTPFTNSTFGNDQRTAIKLWKLA